MATMSATVDGWRARSKQKWYKLDGSWTPCSEQPTINCLASAPVYDSGDPSSNMYCICIKITTPSSIGRINSITIGFCANNYYNTTTATLYGSLRTVDDSYSTINDTIETYRTYVAGGSTEQSCNPSYYASEPNEFSMTFTGVFNAGTSYYLWLYTKSTSDIYQLHQSDTAYYCNVDYSTKQYTITFSAGAGSGSVPATITGYEGDYVTIGDAIPTPPANSEYTTTNFNITAYNGSTKFGTHIASKHVYTKYAFINWQGDGITVQPCGGITITGNISLVAQYGSTKVTEYSNNTISSIMNSIGIPSKSYNEQNIPILLDTSTNGGTSSITTINAKQTGTYTFNGWNTNSGATSSLSIDTKFTVATTIYAIYTLSTVINPAILPTTGVIKASDTISSYTITLNPGSGTVSPTSIVAKRIRGYKFLGWATNPNSSSYITEYTPTKSNETLYAIFDNGTETDQPVTLPIPVRENYAFLGWSIIKDSTEYVDIVYMPSYDITLYANYKVSKAVEMYIWHNGSWKRSIGHLCAQGILFNKCTDA